MQLTGILPAVVTPLAGGTFVPYLFERLLERLYAAGVHGVYVCGQTGEGMQQPPEQRKRVLETAVRCSPPGKLLIIHVGAASTAEAIDLARHAEQAGAHAISSLPPSVIYDYGEIHAYYEELAQATSLPLLLYHHPDVCPILTPDRALELCSIPNVAGFKFTDFNLYLLSLIRGKGVVVFNGRDEVLAAGLLMGATGGIGTFYNLFPGLFVKIFDLANEGRWEEAAALQKALSPVLQEIFRFPLVPAVRAALTYIGLDCGECIAPRRRLAPEEVTAVQATIANLPPKLADYLIRFDQPVSATTIR
jgi:N-acetylneuraminate lyase